MLPQLFLTAGCLRLAVILLYRSCLRCFRLEDFLDLRHLLPVTLGKEVYPQSGVADLDGLSSFEGNSFSQACLIVAVIIAMGLRGMLFPLVLSPLAAVPLVVARLDTSLLVRVVAAILGVVPLPVPLPRLLVVASVTESESPSVLLSVTRVIAALVPRLMAVVRFIIILPFVVSSCPVLRCLPT